MKATMLALISLLISTQIAAQPNSQAYAGYAYDQDENSLVYVEQYLEFFNQEFRIQRSIVHYYSADKELIATKSLDYSRAPYAPSLFYQNTLTGYTESLTWQGNNQVILSRTEPNGKVKSKLLTLESNTQQPYVADAGFNIFVQAFYEQLRNGNTIQFRFLNPARLDWFTFQAKAVESGPQNITILIQPDNRLLRLLVSPITLEYSIPKQDNQAIQLRRYSGLTNMSLDNDHYIRANIRYEYQAKENDIVMMF